MTLKLVVKVINILPSSLYEPLERAMLELDFVPGIYKGYMLCLSERSNLKAICVGVMVSMLILCAGGHHAD